MTETLEGGPGNRPPSICWANNMVGQIGNGYGYSSHANNLRAACERAGSVADPTSDVAVHIITPNKFEPIMGRFNVLYTMYECTTIPDDWVRAMNAADLIVVPCRQNKDLFGNYTKLPVEVCWEGVDPDAFPFAERKMPLSNVFIYLWIGAPNPRKGFEHVGAAWDGWRKSGRMPKNVWLYCKSSGVDKGELVKSYPEMRLTIDTRNLEVHELNGLYRDAHAFMLPSMGEGFGLTLAEAMATGLPCIYTPWGGPRDFADESTGFPVKWEFTNVKVMGQFKDDGKREVYSESYAAYADVDDIIRRMEQIYHGYEKALARGRKAAARIRKAFTWDISARSFLDIIERYAPKAKEQAA